MYRRFTGKIPFSLKLNGYLKPSNFLPFSIKAQLTASRWKKLLKLWVMVFLGISSKYAWDFKCSRCSRWISATRNVDFFCELYGLLFTLVVYVWKSWEYLYFIIIFGIQILTLTPTFAPCLINCVTFSTFNTNRRCGFFWHLFNYTIMNVSIECFEQLEGMMATSVAKVLISDVCTFRFSWVLDNACFQIHNSFIYLFDFYIWVFNVLLKDISRIQRWPAFPQSMT